MARCGIRMVRRVLKVCSIIPVLTFGFTEISSESDSDRAYHVGSDFELTEISQEDLDLPEGKSKS